MSVFIPVYIFMVCIGCRHMTKLNKRSHRHTEAVRCAFVVPMLLDAEQCTMNELQQSALDSNNAQYIILH